MEQDRRMPKRFTSLPALLMELDNAGHPMHRVWFDGKIVDGVRDPSVPVAFLSADCRLLAQRRGDGSWRTLYGYDRANDPRVPPPAEAWNVEDFKEALTFFFYATGRDRQRR
jgi:hypothetical protein